MSYQVLSATPIDAGCPINAAYFSIVPQSTFSFGLMLGG